MLFEPPWPVSTVSVPALHGYILSLPCSLLNFEFYADPNPAFHSDADPAYHTDADPASQNDTDPCGPGSSSATPPRV